MVGANFYAFCNYGEDMVEYIQYVVKEWWRMLVVVEGGLVWSVGTAVEYDEAWLKVW